MLAVVRGPDTDYLDGNTTVFPVKKCSQEVFFGFMVKKVKGFEYLMW
jgi:hypothetical protein